MADRLPVWEEGPVALEDFQDQTDYVRASTPKAGPGIIVQRTPGGSVISSEGSGGVVGRIARTGSSIAAASYSNSTLTAGTGTVTFLVVGSGATWTLGSETATAYNANPTGAVPANSIIQVKIIDGRYVVDVAPCS